MTHGAKVYEIIVNNPPLRVAYCVERGEPLILAADNKARFSTEQRLYVSLVNEAERGLKEIHAMTRANDGVPVVAKLTVEGAGFVQ